MQEFLPNGTSKFCITKIAESTHTTIEEISTTQQQGCSHEIGILYWHVRIFPKKWHLVSPMILYGSAYRRFNAMRLGGDELLEGWCEKHGRIW